MTRLNRPSHLISWRLCAFARTKKNTLAKLACGRQASKVPGQVRHVGVAEWVYLVTISQVYW